MSDTDRHDSNRGPVGAFWTTFRNKDNETPRYERFYYTKRYVRAKSEYHNSEEAQIQIGQALGYNVHKSSFFAKLRKQRLRYDGFERDVPLAYLDAIGVKMHELEVCVEADQELFNRKRKETRYPRVAMVRYMPAVYGTYRFPEGTPEKEAISMLRRSEAARFSAVIVYPELLIVMLDRNFTDPVYDFIEPTYTVGKDRLLIRKLPLGMGMTRV